MQEESIDKTTAADDTSNAVSIKDILSIGLHHWRWIAASVAVCLALAVIYLLFATPVYTRTASLLIKEEGSGSSVNGAVDAFSDLGLFSTNTNINNELSALKSPDIMEDVIKRLDIDMNYRGEGFFRKPILYGMTLPAKVVFPDSNDKQSASFVLRFNEDGGYTVSDFKADNEEYTVDPDVHAFGDSVPTPLGRMVVTRGDGFKDKEAFDLYVSKSPLKAAVTSYTAKLKVALLDDKGTVIDLTVNDPSVPRAAEKIFSTLLSAYIMKTGSETRTRLPFRPQTSSTIVSELSKASSAMSIRTYHRIKVPILFPTSQPPRACIWSRTAISHRRYSS